jgi:hydrogenase maturation factor
MNDERIKSLADAFRSLRLERELRIMEVCGTHTTEFFEPACVISSLKSFPWWTGPAARYA